MARIVDRDKEALACLFHRYARLVRRRVQDSQGRFRSGTTCSKTWLVYDMTEKQVKSQKAKGKTSSQLSASVVSSECELKANRI